MNLRNLHIVYEEWCMQMLRHSQRSWKDLRVLFENKFDELALKLAISQNLSFSLII